MLKKYKPGFELWGLLLFLSVMIPNLIWFAVPAPNDVLRANSITETIDKAASVCQVFMVAALILIKNKTSGKLRAASPFIIIVAGCCLLYFVSWTVYYLGMVNPLVISGLTIPPCCAFLFFAIDRKNGIAIVPISIFTVCHLIYGAVNFIF